MKKKISIGWIIGAVILALVMIYFVAMYAVNRPHDAVWDIVMLEILLFLPIVPMILLAFRPTGTKKIVSLIVLGVLALMLIVSLFLLPGRIADEPMTDASRYGEAYSAIKMWTYTGGRFTPDDFRSVLPKEFPADAGNRKLALVLPYEERPFSLEVSFTLPAESFAAYEAALSEKYPKEPAEENFDYIYIAYETESPNGERCVYYYTEHTTGTVRIFAFDGDAGYVG